MSVQHVRVLCSLKWKTVLILKTHTCPKNVILRPSAWTRCCMWFFSSSSPDWIKKKFNMIRHLDFKTIYRNTSCQSGDLCKLQCFPSAIGGWMAWLNKGWEIWSELGFSFSELIIKKWIDFTAWWQNTHVIVFLQSNMLWTLKMLPIHESTGLLVFVYICVKLKIINGNLVSFSPCLASKRADWWVEMATLNAVLWKMSDTSLKVEDLYISFIKMYFSPEDGEINDLPCSTTGRQYCNAVRATRIKIHIS